MTIRVTISNDSGTGAKSLKVVSVSVIKRQDGPFDVIERKDLTDLEVAPGESIEKWIHDGLELRIVECE